MKFNIRYIVIFFFLLMSFVPFLLLTDLFPFMRFGMFAETFHTNPQREIFTVAILSADGSKHALSERQMAVDDSRLNYLARTYYYNHQLNFFADHLKKSGLLKKNEKVLIEQNQLEANHWKKNILLIK